jgi:alcohol dehydrogenase (cytochrome c)
VDGGANWMSHSYSPLTKLLYVFAREERRVFTKDAVRHPTTAAEEDEGRPVGGPVFRRRGPRFAPEESWGKVTAIDPSTGAIKWEHKVLSPPWGGVMATAGNLVFGGTLEGVVFALDARTGQRLWHFAGNDRVYSSPISYLAGGKQYVSLPVGDVLITFALD